MQPEMIIADEPISALVFATSAPSLSRMMACSMVSWVRSSASVGLPHRFRAMAYRASRCSSIGYKMISSKNSCYHSVAEKGERFAFFEKFYEKYAGRTISVKGSSRTH